MKHIIYADNAATTKMDIETFEAMKPYLLNEYGNASQLYLFAQSAKKALKKSRETIANCIGSQPDEIYFTSGGTESDNWAIKGSAFADLGKRIMVTSVIEHHAVLRACSDIERMGYPVTYLPVNHFGEIETYSLSKIITKDTRLVSIMLSNNEIGTIQNIRELANIAHSSGAIFHTDAVQAVGHMNINVNSLLLRISSTVQKELAFCIFVKEPLYIHISVVEVKNLVCEQAQKTSLLLLEWHLL